MADAESYNKPQLLVSKIGSSIPPIQEDPRKFYSHFIYKAVIVAVFIVILPFFPSQAPEFINQNVITRNWELLHLLLVGITVSYGLFSRRNVETENENQSKIDSAQNYVSKILQVSSVFDDEVESPSGYDENKVQTWNSRYSRGEPVVLVAQENSVLDEQSHSNTSISNKPLLLPVRSLRSRVSSDHDDIESINESSGFSGSLTRSGSGLKGSSNNSVKNRKREIGVSNSLDLEGKLRENAVLPSPIPWRSRSGRMEMKEEVGSVTPPLYSLPPSVDEFEFDQFESRSFGSPLSWSSRPSSTSSSPKKLSPSHSLSPELRAKTGEDLGRKKSFYKPSPPPPPPPPPPISRRSPLIISNSSPNSSRFSSDKYSKKSFKDELKDLSRNSREDLPSRAELGLDSLNSEVTPRTHLNGPSMGRSVREIRESEPTAGVRKAKEIGGDRIDGIRSKEVEGRKIGGFDQMSEKQNRESPYLTPKPTMSKYQKEEMKEFAEKVIIESEEDSDIEDNDIQGSSDNEEAVSTTVGDAGPDPNEVDKKADEFIAKFREQIRLQRIELIKKSSGHRSSRNS